MTRNRLKLRKDSWDYKTSIFDALAAGISLECKGVFKNKIALKELYSGSELDEVEEIKNSINPDNDERTLTEMEDNITFLKQVEEKSLNPADVFVNEHIASIRNTILNSKYHYSHKIDTKVNRAIVQKETIFGTREKDGDRALVNTFSNIYEAQGIGGETSGGKLATILRGKSKTRKDDSILMFNNDIYTFEALKYIANELYPNEKNPFLKYKENYGLIKKCSKKDLSNLKSNDFSGITGKGAPIVNVKYYVSKVETCLDISHKVGAAKDSKKAILLGNICYRADIYIHNGVYYSIGIPRVMFKFKGNKYILDIDKYNELYRKRGIPQDAEFLFSLHKGEQFNIEKGEYGKKNHIKGRFLMLSPPNIDGNIIEAKTIEVYLRGYYKYRAAAIKDNPDVELPYNYDKERVHFTFNKDIKRIFKERVDILGNIYTCTKEKFVTEFKL